MIQTLKVTLAGEKSLFRNTRPLVLQELTLVDSLHVENSSPLTVEEAQGKEKPATQVTIGKFFGPVESSLTNTGFLTIHEGVLGTVYNRGVVDVGTNDDFHASARWAHEGLSADNSK